MTSDAKWRIMVVDDERPLLNMLLEMLGKEYEAVGAFNGFDALEKLERYEPDLIILDVLMPCVDGIDTCRAIRRNARYRDLPVILITGQDPGDFSERIKELGAARFLRKPVRAAQLMECCQEAIESSGKTSPPSRRFTLADLLSGRPDSDAVRQAMPSAPSAPPQPPLQTPEAKAPLARPKVIPRVMIIDDDRDVISYMITVLGDRFEALGVRAPLSAMYRIIRYQPDLIILDIAMPGMSGYQLSQLLRLNPNLRTIKVMFASSKDTPQEIAYAMKLGAADYLVKPFSGEDLMRKVMAIVELPDFFVREKAMRFEEILQIERSESSPALFS